MARRKRTTTVIPASAITGQTVTQPRNATRMGRTQRLAMARRQQTTQQGQSPAAMLLGNISGSLKANLTVGQVASTLDAINASLRSFGVSV